nr:glutaminyl-peptide cyclotransferase [Corynebacterium sp. UBA5992]
MGSSSHARRPSSGTTPHRAPAPTYSLRKALSMAFVPLVAVSITACTSDAADSEPGSATGSATQSDVEKLNVVVHERVPMLADSFTQGLEVDEQGKLLIGTGQYGKSRLLRFDPAVSTVLQQEDLPADYFGEGITRSGDRIWQLTWKNERAMHYDADTLEKTGEISYPGQGWGLCAMPDELIMSDGSAQLRHLDPTSFAERGPRSTVTREGSPVSNINELECVDGLVYANVWKSTELLRINPASGEVNGVIDASALDDAGADSKDNVLNGIAHIPGSKDFWITGKRWADLYRVSFE